MSSQHFCIVLEGKSFQVVVDDAGGDLVQVTVDGETFQVQVEPSEQAGNPPAQPGLPVVPFAALTGGMVKAPMPGTIVEINVKPGDQVETGQELCVLEAMKMNNSIRATRPGRVAQVHVATKQLVQHGDVLIVLAD